MQVKAAAAASLALNNLPINTASATNPLHLICLIEAVQASVSDAACGVEHSRSVGLHLLAGHLDRSAGWLPFAFSCNLFMPPLLMHDDHISPSFYLPFA
jgi:hypothetical protein